MEYTIYIICLLATTQATLLDNLKNIEKDTYVVFGPGVSTYTKYVVINFIIKC